MHIKIQFHHTSFTWYVLHIIQTHQHTRVLKIIQCHHESSSVCDYASIIHPGQNKQFCAFIFKRQLLDWIMTSRSKKKKKKVRCPLFVEVLSWLCFLFLLVGRAEKGSVFKVDHLTLPHVHLIHCNTGVLYKQDKTTSVRKDKLAVLKEKQGNKMFLPFSQLIICKQHVISMWMLQCSVLINTIVGYT